MPDFEFSGRNVEDICHNLGVRQLDKIHVQNYKFLGTLCKTIILVLVCGGTLFLYAAIISKFIPNTGNKFLDAIKRDVYFCYLLPLMTLPTIAVIYLKWLTMTLFKYN